MKNLEFPFKNEVLFASKTQYMVQISCIKLEKINQDHLVIRKAFTENREVSPCWPLGSMTI